MKFEINDFLDKYAYDSDKRSFFADFAIVEVLYRKSKDLIMLKIHNSCILPYELHRDFSAYLKTLGLNNFSLYFKVENQNLSLREFSLYLKEFANEYSIYSEAICECDEMGIFLSYLDHDLYDRDKAYIDDLKLYFYNLGYRKDIPIRMKKINDEPVIIEKEPLKAIQKEEKPAPAAEKKSYYKPRNKTYTHVVIDDLVDDLYNVSFEGTIFKVEERETRTGMLVQTLYVKDVDNAVIVKVLGRGAFNKETLALNKEGKTAIFYGNYRYDSFLNDRLFEPDKIEFVEKKSELVDNAEVKRVELHCHTNKSEMDGVCSTEEMVKAAFAMGHNAIAITDHLNVQGFPRAQHTAAALTKGTDRKFKILYGCEFNVVDERLHLVYNKTNEALSDKEYVVFDLETTGLSTRHDHIIEFGAVLMKRGMVVEKKDFFIKPPIAVSDTIKELTNITESQLANARTFKEAKDEILDFLKANDDDIAKRRVLVAHNASFDYGFLNEELKRIGCPIIENPVIDTLDLAKALYPHRRNYRLGNIARQFDVPYDEEVAHRADYDANVLADIFNLMLKELSKMGITTLKQLEEKQDEKTALVKNRAYHCIALCKNAKGLKDLFKLVSISNTETLAVTGKTGGKGEGGGEVVAEPRLYKRCLQEYRENLLLGSACVNGEIFEIAHTRSKEELAKAISFFDYIEIQPLENYRFLLERGTFDLERLKTYLRDIIAEAKRQNKIIVATGDAHYALREEKILRDVYINAQGIGGVHHPLFIYNKDKRKTATAPDQHFRSTDEMLECFKWLDDRQLVQDLVINNTNRIADMIEEINPIHSGLFPPTIEGSADKLTDLVWSNARKIYGEKLDPLITARIEKELKAIIGHGYAVIYYVSHLLCKKSNDDGYLVGSRGSVGSSLVATFSNISECNPLPPHYICPHCHYLEWTEHVKSGYDLPEKNCPVCGHPLNVDGQNIPFETFLGFKGDKVPDIDLNFSGDYQPTAHLYIREMFGEDHAYRAGTIGTVAEKTAFGYVLGYCEEKGIENMSKAQKQRLASGCEGVKRTTGQHPAGIIVIPHDMDVYDFTPVQYPANDPSSSWKTTHFDFHEIHDNVLKFDILGHVDPTAMRLFETISGIDVRTIPMNDPKVMSIFNSSKELNIINPDYHEETGACGLPEFGTKFVRGILEETRPSKFSELVQISGLSHGTDVWLGNAKDLIDGGLKLADVIGCRDDIMSDLLSYDLPSKDAFDIMEKVRKGKGVSPEFEQEMLEHNVPKWYIESCKKIKYMFPKAHAVAYVIMAVRVAWFKVYHPEYYYVSYFTLRCDDYEIETMIKDADGIKRRLDQLGDIINDKTQSPSKKDRDIYNTLEISFEMASRGYRMSNIDLNRSMAKEFIVDPDDNHCLIPPFRIIAGLGDNVAESIVAARNSQPFLSKEDLLARTQLSSTLIKKLDDLGALKGLDDTNQMTLF
ncbi:MAG: PolC-type DNA polymerase III [Erysipelotrichaceae bacterium]|nr:PolC-type DNA polymerase III [Erysipelotrichaceae bacterium]